MSGFVYEFMNPSGEYSPFPFWFLNGDLKEEKLEKQLKDFASKGIFGVVLHPRIGVPKSLEYLSDAFMEKIVFIVKCAEKLGMKVLLYDEGMYPSGSAHGKVVEENPDYAAKGIRLLKDNDTQAPDEKTICRIAVRMTGDSEYAYDSARVLQEGERGCPGETVLTVAGGFTGGTIRGIHEEEDDGQAFAPKAGDLLNPDAMQAFIRLTHERYYQYLSEEFSTVVIGFFTDEPCPAGRSGKPGMLPWTDGFEKEIEEKGFQIKDYPALWLACDGHENGIRAQYDRLVNERLIRTYYRPISQWCVRHGINLCGHPHSAQDSAILKEFQIPGQDIVWRWVAPEGDRSLSGEQSAQAKCASDIARHTGARRNLNECFGCCGPEGEMWALNVSDMKWYLNWLFVRGCNFIVPHAFFYELDTPLKADRPPDVGPNNIFWDEYPVISAFIKRMCMLNTDSVNQAAVAVLGSCSGLEVDGVRALYENQIEFNYLLDEHLAEAQIKDGMIIIRNQKYKALMVPQNLTYAPGTDALIQRAKDAGVYVTREADAVVFSYKTVAVEEPSKNIRVSYIKRDQQDAVILSNEGDTPYTGRIVLPFSGKTLLLNPWEGTIHTLLNEEGSVHIHVGAREMVVITNAGWDKPAAEYRTGKTIKYVKKTDDLWRLRLPSGSWTEGLRDWQNIEEIRVFSGELLYEAKASFDKITSQAILELGDVREKAKVFVNGKYAGVRIAPPYRFDVSGFIRKGENEIRVWITNSLVGKYEKKSWKSGMLGGTEICFYDD